MHLSENPETPIVHCSDPRCGQNYCFRDKVPWTDGHNCKDYETRLRDGEKRCPSPNCQRIVRFLDPDLPRRFIPFTMS
jgi:hypothetical protein